MSAVSQTENHMSQIRGVSDFQRIGKSFEIQWAGMLALYLAVERKRKTIGIEEYFSGLYLIARDILVSYWRDSFRLDKFVRGACKLTEPAWCYWIEFHQAMHTPKYSNGILVPYAAEMEILLNDSTKLALKEKAHSRRRQEVRAEHFIAALLSRPTYLFTRRLLASGISLQRLDKSTKK